MGNQIKRLEISKQPETKYKILSICGGGVKIVYFFGILESIL